MASSPIRSYSGKSAEKRINERRRKLLDTAFEIMAADGWRQVTIDKICRRARLNKRYFYESFSNPDELAASVVDEIAASVVETGFRSVREALEAGLSTEDLARKVLGAIVTYVTEDQRRAHVLFKEAAGSPAAVAHRKETILGLAKTLSAYAHEHHGATGAHAIAELGSAILIGGSIEAILTWLDGGIAMSKEEFIEDLAALWVILGDGAADRERARQPVQDEAQ